MNMNTPSVRNESGGFYSVADVSLFLSFCDTSCIHVADGDTSLEAAESIDDRRPPSETGASYSASARQCHI